MHDNRSILLEYNNKIFNDLPPHHGTNTLYFLLFFFSAFRYFVRPHQTQTDCFIGLVGMNLRCNNKLSSHLKRRFFRRDYVLEVLVELWSCTLVCIYRTTARLRILNNHHTSCMG